MRKIALLSLSVLGLFVSLYLWWEYTSPSRPMACLGGGCDAARASSYAHLMGIPTPVLGVVMYSILILLVFGEALLGTAWASWLRLAMVGVSAVGFGASVFLSGIEEFVLHAWCVWCATSALSVTGIFVLAVWELWRPAATPEPGAKLKVLRPYFIVVVAGVVLGLPAFALLSRSHGKPSPPAASAEILRERLIRPDSHSFGNPDAAVTVVEFGDFECPYCGDAERAAREVRQKYRGEIRFVFRQFPLARIHPYAEKAAEASECAAQQGKFWQAVDELYDHQEHLGVPALEGYARDLGLDTARFNSCLTSGAMAARVKQDVEDGHAVGVTRTPTFFVDGRRIEGALTFAQFSELLNQDLTAHGTPPPAAVAQGAGAEKPSSPATTKAQASSGGLLGGGGNPFSSFQGGGCSEKEASERQAKMISTAEARRLFEGHPKALFVDVRSRKEFLGAHISGAMNLPSGEVTQRAASLPKDRTVVLYEGGGAGNARDVCAASRAVASYLLEHGYSAKRVFVYQQGLQAWEKAGLPVEPSAAAGQ